MAGTCECGNEPSGSIKCGEFLNWLRNGQLLKKDCSPPCDMVASKLHVCCTADRSNLWLDSFRWLAHSKWRGPTHRGEFRPRLALYMAEG